MKAQGKAQAWFANRSVRTGGASRKRTVLQPHSGMALRDSDEGESSQGAEFQVVYLVTHFVWKEK